MLPLGFILGCSFIAVVAYGLWLLYDNRDKWFKRDE